jgi:ParB family chromosome partitioning protein
MSGNKLGRGIDALITTDFNEKSEENGVITVKIDEIEKNPYQPRKVFDNEKLEELSLSIKENGLIQPIIVTKTDNGYEIIAGERRYLASKMAGLTEIPVIVKNATPKEKLQFAIVENVQREDLNAIEEAKAYELLHKDFSLTHKEIANLVGKERVTISNLIRLLKLPPKIQHMILSEKITSGHARAILSVDDKFKADFADYIAIKQISVRYAERLAKKINELDSMDFLLHPQKSIIKEWTETEKKLKKQYNVKIKITNKNEKGKIQFYFNSNEELNELLEKLIKK